VQIYIKYLKNRKYNNIYAYLWCVIKIHFMYKGTVKFFNEAKGFGFIKDSDSDKEYFVHANGLKDDIRENDEVTFELEEGRKGLNAVDVKLA
jgi:cold shock protein